MRRAMCRSTLLLAAVLLTSGCITTSHKLDVAPKLETLPPASRQALHAGVYYASDLEVHTHFRSFGTHTVVAPIGRMSVRMFDDLLPRVFERTKRISSPTASEMRDNKLDLAVAISLEHFDFRLGMDSDSDRYSIAYRTTLYSPAGIPVASWVVVGNGPPGGMMSGIGDWLEGDMKNAAGKFLDSFERLGIPALAAMDRNRRAPALTIDPRQVDLSARQSALPALEPPAAAALTKAGLRAFQVTALSTAERPLIVRASDMRLRLKNGYDVEPAAVSTVLTLIEISSKDSAAASAFAGPLFGILVSNLESRSRQNEQELRFRAGTQAAFEDRVLPKDKPQSGVVMFRLPGDGGGMDTAKLVVWVVDPETAAGTQIEIPISAVQ